MRTLNSLRTGAPVIGASRSVYLWWAIWIVWLPLFIPNLVTFIQGRPGPIQLVASLAGTALFFALYLWTTLQCAGYLASPSPLARPTSAPLWVPIVAMVALCVIFVLTGKAEIWGSLFIYASAASAGWLPVRSAVLVILGMALFTIIGLGRQGQLSAAISPVTFITVPGFVVIALVQSVKTSQQLRAAREEVASLAAVTEERLRIARDLHDLLGHNLSLIALKSELARRLVNVSPERAAAEIGDVESVARKALQEVREAVAGYRQPSLASELTGAREILTAAGIIYRYEGDERASRGLPAAVDAALAWVVREGVTNVIRHSHARSCTLSLAHNTHDVSVEIVDDGVSVSAASVVAPAQTPGAGLRGLSERMQALAGACEFSPRASGGFRLYVSAPLGRAVQATPAPNAQPSAVTLLGDHISTQAQRADEPIDAEARP